MTTVSRLEADVRWWRWSAAAGAARMPAAMALLALVFLGEQATGSYAVGAALAGSYAFSEALFAPWRGRVLDRLPAQRRRSALRRSLTASALVLAALAAAGYAHAPVPVLLVLTAAAAALPAGMPGGYRALLTELLDVTVLPRAFSWDAAAVEVEWLLAPLLVSAALLPGQPAVAVLLMAGWALLGAWITGLLPAASAATSAIAEQPGRSAWRQRAAWPSYLTSYALGVGEGGLIAVLPVLLLHVGQHPGVSGALAAVLAGASAVGGLAPGRWGHRLPGSPGTQADVALALMSLLLLPVAFGSRISHLVIALVAGGLFIAPVNALRAQALQDALPSQQRGEGFSIQYGANGLGTAAGAAVTAALANTCPKLALTNNLTIPLLTVTATALTTCYRRQGGRPIWRTSIATGGPHRVAGRKPKAVSYGGRIAQANSYAPAGVGHV